LETGAYRAFDELTVAKKISPSSYVSRTRMKLLAPDIVAA
jgi:hypothetical protein